MGTGAGMLPAMTSLMDRRLPEELWQRIQPLLPPPAPRPRGGVPRRVPDRNCMAALSFMPAPPPPGACSRPRSSAAARPPPAGGGWTSGPRRGVRPAPDAAAGRAGCGRPDRPGAGQRRLLQPAGGQRGDLTGANPVDRGKAGSKLHLAAERGGLPLAVVLSAANANDSTLFEAVLDDIPPILMPTGRRRRRPARSMPIRPTIIGAAAATCADEGSARGSLGVASNPPSGWAVTVGRSSAPARGSVGGDGCGSAMSGMREGSTRWCSWPSQ
jgi:Transposase DDE domain